MAYRWTLAILMISTLTAQQIPSDTKAQDDDEWNESLLDEQASQKQATPKSMEGDMDLITLSRYIDSKASVTPTLNKQKSSKKPGHLPEKRSIPFQIEWLTQTLVGESLEAIVDRSRCELAIKEAMEEIKKKTCIRFTPHIKETNYISFALNNVGALADIGVEPGKQKIFITVRSCYMGTILHEILHTLGMMHEHTRMDRDSYIDINITNIKDGMIKNFEKYPHLIGDDLPYDYDSVMHPPANWFSKDPENHDTIRPNNIMYHEQRLGQRNGLSKLDAAKLNTAFQCPEKFLDKQELPQPDTPQLNPPKEEKSSPTPAPLDTTTAKTTKTTPSENEQDLSTEAPDVNEEKSDDDSDDISETDEDKKPLPIPDGDHKPPLPLPVPEPPRNYERRKIIRKHALKLNKRRKHKN